MDQSFHGSIVDMGVQGVINIWGNGGGVAMFLKQCPVKLFSDTGAILMSASLFVYSSIFNVTL